MSEERVPSKRNAVETRARILAAAVQCFAEHGYSATGTRDVALRANVSLPLVTRYFGSKAGLFEQAMESSLKSEMFLPIERENFGVQLVRLIVGSPHDTPVSIAMLGAADPEARKIATRVVADRVIEPLSQWLGQPGARSRAIAISMLGAGLATHLHLLPMTDPVSIYPEHPILVWFAESFQRIVDDKGDESIWSAEASVGE